MSTERSDKKIILFFYRPLQFDCLWLQQTSEWDQQRLDKELHNVNKKLVDIKLEAGRDIQLYYSFLILS